MPDQLQGRAEVKRRVLVIIFAIIPLGVLIAPKACRDAINDLLGA